MSEGVAVKQLQQVIHNAVRPFTAANYLKGAAVGWATF